MSTVARRKPSMPVTLNDARVMFRNFGGKQGQYNPPGKRNFVVFLPFEIARILEQDGWNIKQLKSREEGEVPQDYIKVNVKLDSYKPPKIYMINSRGRTQIDESMVDMLDWVDFGKVDLIISPYNYEVFRTRLTLHRTFLCGRKALRKRSRASSFSHSSSNLTT